MSYLFFVGVILSVDINTPVDIALSPVTKFLILFKYLVVKCIDLSKLLVRSVSMSVYFVLDFASCLADWYHPLDVKHIFAEASSAFSYLAVV